MTFNKALAQLKETRVLSTDLLSPLGIPFEYFLRLSQMSEKKHQNIITKIINHLEKINKNT